MRFFRNLFAPRVTIRSEARELTPAEVEALERAFDRVDDAFAEVDKAFKVFGRIRDGKP